MIVLSNINFWRIVTLHKNYAMLLPRFFLNEQEALNEAKIMCERDQITRLVLETKHCIKFEKEISHDKTP